MFADGGEPTIVIPVILEPIEIQVTLDIIPVEIGHVAITTRVLPNRANEQSIFSATIL